MAKEGMMTPNPYPFVNVPVAPVAPAQRYRMRYGVLECVTCGLAKDYCKGHQMADMPASDGAESDLVRRVRECRGGR